MGMCTYEERKRKTETERRNRGKEEGRKKQMKERRKEGSKKGRKGKKEYHYQVIKWKSCGWVKAVF